MIIAIAAIGVVVVGIFVYWRRPSPRPRSKDKIPVSVNYFFTRQCNKTCGFCFHTAKTSHMEDISRAKLGLHKLKEAGMKKINFAGGEPFLYPKYLGELVDFCKQDLRLESVSIITNGSLVKEDWVRKHGKNVDILACSCDSFDEQTNIEIGRGTGDQVTILYRIAQWCRENDILFKLNTVVTRLNYQEDMNQHIETLSPFRWKVFQVLIVEGENDSEKTLRDARKFTITDDQFEDFCEKHKHHKSFVAEPNRLMAASYLLVDEYMRFIDKDGNKLSQSILDVGVEEAMKDIKWDVDAFEERGGVYDWTKELEKGDACSGGMDEKLQW
ncbi:Radical S-adenosyl methionine domain-containing protein 2 [Escovopsis weberi]|uniref:Radical S-adenosyl methionine domain-containing protein 2 n=1 Tax=Escovopsis weberi TaxID=150374 RepID=A0A0M9VRH0_ESCWE|nr:Radical S-adenosyl methionine domain-containing protein 2 [Escovopsis weberi]